MGQINQLNRFLEAQASIYHTALEEIKSGRKQTHWIWFIFPQIAGLGSTEISLKYSIRTLFEASDYLSHPVLGTRLREISGELLKLQNLSAYQIFGPPDDKKLRSCMTLFCRVEPREFLFKRVLKKYFAGEEDQRTLEIIER